MQKRARRLTAPVVLLLKGIRIGLLLLSALTAALVVSMAPVAPARRRAWRIANTAFFARRALAAFGVRVVCHGRIRHARRRGGVLIVANHVSYVDILVLASVMPAAFVTSVELRHTFPLGLLARLGGSLFVERRSPAGLKQEIGEIAQVLADGQSVALFPEGTTTNGTSVRLFKNSLFTAAIDAGAPVQPVCLRYSRIDNGPITERNRDALYYYGGVTFFEHLPRFLALRSVDVSCTFLPLLAFRPGRSRKELAAAAHQAVTTAHRCVRPLGQ